jgi:hypothetical protein
MWQKLLALDLANIGYEKTISAGILEQSMGAKRICHSVADSG